MKIRNRYGIKISNRIEVIGRTRICTDMRRSDKMIPIYPVNVVHRSIKKIGFADILLTKGNPTCSNVCTKLELSKTYTLIHRYFANITLDIHVQWCTWTMIYLFYLFI